MSSTPEDCSILRVQSQTESTMLTSRAVPKDEAYVGEGRGYQWEVKACAIAVTMFLGVGAGVGCAGVCVPVCDAGGLPQPQPRHV